MVRTKITATVGPASSSKQMLRSLIEAGVDVFRFNFSHGSHEEHLATLGHIRSLNLELGTYAAVLADLSGPKIRTGVVPDNALAMEAGDRIVFTTQPGVTGEGIVFVNYAGFAEDVKPGEIILLDDGKIQMVARESNGTDTVAAEALHKCVLSSRKGINLPNTHLKLPALSEKDLNDLDFIVENEFNWIALSFVRTADDMLDLKNRLKEKNPKNMPRIMAKIEKPEGVENIDSILQVADGIMIARGDLAVEIPQERVPVVQKLITKKCISMSKPVIVATQMMEGMILNVRPTRAELNDVANAVIDGADTLMLSGETSVGNYPVETVETMSRIIQNVEDFENLWHKTFQHENPDQSRLISDSIIMAATDLAEKINAKALLGMTNSGYSAFRMAGHRTKTFVHIFSSNKWLLATLNLLWGVSLHYLEEVGNTDEIMTKMREHLVGDGVLEEGDYVVHILSTPINELGKTNTMKLAVV